MTSFGLRTRFIVFLALAFTPLFILLAWTSLQQYRSTLDAAKRDVQQLAEHFATQQSSAFRDARTFLDVLRHMPPVSAAGGDACRRLMASLAAANPQFHTIGVVDNAQMVTCHNTLTEVQKFGRADLLKHMMRADAPDFNVGEFGVGKVSKKPTVVVSLKLPAVDGVSPGAVFASMNLSHLSQLAGSGLSHGRTAAVLEMPSGKLLARYPAMDVPFGSIVEKHPIIDAMRQDGYDTSGYAEGVGQDGQDRLFGYAPLSGVGDAQIVASIGISRAEVLAAVNQRAVVSVLIFLCVLAFTCAGTWWMGYWTQLRPIARLRKTAHRIAMGDLEARSTIEKWQAPELRALGDAFDAMATKLAEGRAAEQTVAESYRYLKIAERMAHVGYWQYDPRSGRSTWSDEVFRLHDLPIVAEPPSFEDCVAACHEDDRKIVRSSFAKAVGEGAEFEIQIRIVRTSGEIRHVLSRACVEKDETGAVTLIYGAILDVTDLKKSELKVQAANAMLLMAEEVSEVGHWRLDLRSGVLMWSEQVHRMHGQDPATYKPLLETAIEAYHPDDRADVARIVAEAIEGKQSYEFQKRILRPDGSIRDVVSRGRCEVDSRSGNVVALFGVIMDVTSTRMAERQLKAKSTLLATTLDTMSQGLIMIGSDGRLDVSNRRFAELLEIPDHLLQDARPDFEVILAYLDERGEYAESDPSFRRQVRTRSAPFTLGTYERRRPNGRILEVRTVALEDGSGIVRTYNDITDQRDAESRLKESELRYRMLVENASDMIFRLDRDLVRTYVSPASIEILGYTPDELVGKRALSLVDLEGSNQIQDVYAAVLGGLERAEITCRIQHKDGHWIWVEVELRALRDPVTNDVTGILGALRDVSERKQAEDLVAASEARFRMLAENTADLITYVDASGERIFASPAAFELLGYTPEELIGGRPLDLAHPDDRPALSDMLDHLGAGQQAEALQYRARRKGGEYRWIEASGRPLGVDKGFILALRDIDRRKQIEGELETAVLRLKTLANSDGLTCLANRRKFDETLEKEIARAARNRGAVSLLLADVDHFKAFNDTYGHLAGDACLRKVAEVMAAVIRRPADLPARYGGEEFAAILPDTDEAGALALADILRNSVAAAGLDHVHSPTGHVTISVGVVTIVPRPGITKSSDLIDAADSALYKAKRNGRNCISQFHLRELDLAQAG